MKLLKTVLASAIAAAAFSATTQAEVSTNIAVSSDYVWRGVTQTGYGAAVSGGIDYADAPVARTRAAAEAGTLSIMVGARQAVFDRIEPYLRCCAEEVTHCGEVGAGQVAKLMNNMVLFQTVVALAEALSIARAAGVDGEVLFTTLMKGSADSFALRNPAMKSLLPGEFPSPAFSTEYALKDLGYALALAADGFVDAPGARATRKVLEETILLGFGDEYFPALLKVIEPARD